MKIIILECQMLVMKIRSIWLNMPAMIGQDNKGLDESVNKHLETLSCNFCESQTMIIRYNHKDNPLGQIIFEIFSWMDKNLMKLYGFQINLIEMASFKTKKC